MNRSIRLMLALYTVVCLPACAALVPPYSAEAIEARVVDADTKQPLEGVIVTANWELRGGGLALGGSTAVGQIQVMEAVTDQNGRFFFPAWGPIKQFKGELHDKDPQLLFFKSGYAYRILWNDYRGDPPAMKVVHRSQWNGKTIEMKRFTGAMQEYVRRFDDWNSALDQIIRRNPNECNWKKLPEAVLGTERERKNILAQLREHGVVDPRMVGSVYQDILYNNDWYTKNSGKDCGSPKAFFERYKP
jgi:hypothetical protein